MDLRFIEKTSEEAWTLTGSAFDISVLVPTVVLVPLSGIASLLSGSNIDVGNLVFSLLKTGWSIRSDFNMNSKKDVTGSSE
jgi:hypothetical protein